MAEYIEREALLKEFGEEPYIWMDTDYEIQEHNDWLRYTEIVRNFTAADVVERKRGRWTAVKPNGIGATARCSTCGDAIYGYNTMNFCPSCGSDMREVDHAT